MWRKLSRQRLAMRSCQSWQHLVQVRDKLACYSHLVSSLYICSHYFVAKIVPTSVPGDRENDCTCSEESSSSAVIAVSAVSLLLILTLTTVILTQCLLIFRMRRSRNKTYAEATNPTTKTTDVPFSPNEVYALTKITSPRKEVTYEVVK